jgi:DNA-binding ferritin-like protein (Dps family)
VAEAIGDDVDEFVDDLVAFAHSYADRARNDHHLFVAAFRSDGIPGVAATTKS